MSQFWIIEKMEEDQADKMELSRPSLQPVSGEEALVLDLDAQEIEHRYVSLQCREACERGVAVIDFFV